MAPETSISGIANNERNRQNGEHFGDYITMAAAATLAEAYEPHVDIPEFERLLLTALQKPQGIFEFGPIPETILLNSYRAFWLHAKENTSSYPHTLLFSTMKAGAQSNLIA